MRRQFGMQTAKLCAYVIHCVQLGKCTKLFRCSKQRAGKIVQISVESTAWCGHKLTKLVRQNHLTYKLSETYEKKYTAQKEKTQKPRKKTVLHDGKKISSSYQCTSAQ